MAEEIVVSVSPHETRVAVIEQGLLQEIFIERVHAGHCVGNIYKGKVLRVLPGMQSVFVDIGQERAAFMHVNDLIDTHEAVMRERGPEFKLPPINELLNQGQTILVQVTKEPIGTKGARITGGISLASRFLVYMPETHHIGISQRIEEEEERERLREILLPEQGPQDGFIVRTACEGAGAKEIAEDARLLRSRWNTVKDDFMRLPAPAVVFEDLPLHLRVMRDLINENTARIVTDNAEIHAALERFLGDFIPHKETCLEMSRDNTPLFDLHSLEDQIATALERKVPLKSGGYLVFDQTEAMSTIDVNTGAFVGRRDLEETIYRTNLEAAAAIPRQLRLRNIGGIVIVDFIDMLNEEHKRQVFRTLEKGQQTDRVKWNISEISELGLVEMTRKRTHQSLQKRLCEPCPTCEGRGYVKTAESVCLEIFRDVQRRALDLHEKECMIMASQTVVDRLLDEDADSLKELADSIEATFRLNVEATYTQEQYDVVLVS